MSIQNTHTVVSGDTLYSLAKKYGTSISELKSLNRLTGDVIKVRQLLKLPATPKTPSSTVGNPPLKFPFIIAESKNNMSGQDSKYSTNRKLPSHFISPDSSLYRKSKKELHQMLSDLMTKAPDILSKLLLAARSATIVDDILIKALEADLAFTKTDLFKKSNAAARDYADKFVANRQYSESAAYSNSTTIALIRESAEFKAYVADISKRLQSVFIKQGNKIEQGKLLFNDFRTFHFQGENKYLNYFNSLIITIDQVSHIQVELNNVIYNQGKPSKLITTFILHDTYGLDMADLNKFGSLQSYEILTLLEDWETLSKTAEIRSKRTKMQEAFSVLLGNYFCAWWILQYYHGCVPLWVKLRIENVEITL